MPSLGSPLLGLAKEKKISHVELVRAIHLMVTVEREATSGEFLLLLDLAPDEAKFYAESEKEVEEAIEA